MYTVHVAYLIVLTILSVPVWALNVDLAWSLSLDNVYNGSEMKQVLVHVTNYYTVTCVVIAFILRTFSGDLIYK